MKRGFRGAPRPLLPSMLLVATNPNAGQEHAAVAQSQPSSSSPQPTPTPPPITTPTPPPITTPTPPPITTPTPPPIPTPTPPSIPSPTPPPDTEPTPLEHIYEEQSPVHHHFSPPQEQAPSQMPMDDLLHEVPKKVIEVGRVYERRNLVLTDSEEEEPEVQGRKSQDDPLDSSVQGLVTPPTTKVSIDKGRRYKRRKETKEESSLKLGFSRRVDAGVKQIKDKGEGESPICISEETPKKSKGTTFYQEEASLAESKLEEEELTEQQKKRKAQVQFEAQHYTNEDWDFIRAKIEANAELSKSMLGSELQGEDFAKKMVDLVNQRKKIKEWKLSQLKKLSLKTSLKRFGEELQTKTPKRLKEDEAKDDEPTKKSGKETKRRKQWLGTKTPINPVPVAMKTPSIPTYKIIKQGEKGVYQIVREDGRDIVYINFGAMLKSISRDDLTDSVSMGEQRSMKDEMLKISTSIFITNFLENFNAKDLWNACNQYGNVVDAFIPNRRSKSGDSDVEGVPEIKFEEDIANFNKEYVSVGQNDDRSEDPFNIYGLLNKRQDDKNKGSISVESRKYPPGFTPMGRREVHSNEVNESKRESVEGCQSTHEEEVVSGIQKNGLKNKSKEDIKGSVCSCHFKKPKDPCSGSLILQLMDNLVKVGQTIGYNMEGCPKGLWVPTGNNLLIISVYAPQELAEKKMLWDYLTHAMTNWKDDVVMMGDFNKVRKKAERFGSVFNVQGVDALKLFISNAGLEEIPLGGCSFTWCHKSATKMSKLDHFLISEGLISSCPNISAITLDRYLFDHRPNLMRETHYDYGPIPFRFLHYWFDMEGFDTFVEETWKEAHVVDFNAMVKLMKKLKYLKENIHVWNKAKKEITKNSKISLKAELAELNSVLDKGEDRNYDPMDDEPIWAVDHVVAPTPGFAITILETANEFAIKALFDRLLEEIRAFSQQKNESLTDAWLRMKEMLRNCHGHNLSKGNIIKIFYHGLSEITQEVLNAAAGCIFLYKTPNQAYQLLEDKVLLKRDCSKNQKAKTSLKKTVAFADEGSSNSNTDKIMARMDAMTLKMDAQYKELQNHAKKTKPDDDAYTYIQVEEKINSCKLFVGHVFTMITATVTQIAIICIKCHEVVITETTIDPVLMTNLMIFKNNSMIS
ncbi:RNA-directed DNA polymerase, eukaryota, reverse transcriptase zinc-binding domain protein [Tanacetum coccineum]